MDLCLLALAMYICFALRLTLLLAPGFYDDMIVAVIVFPACVVAALCFGGVYRIHWPQASVEEYARLARSYILGVTLFLCFNSFMTSFTIPRSSLAIAPLAGFVLIGAMRASWRLAEFSMPSYASRNGDAKRAVIIGAGEAGAFIARDLQRRNSDIIPLGFIDEDSAKRGKVIAGLPVLGGDESLLEEVRRLGANVVLIAIPSASGVRVRGYLDMLSRPGIEVRVLPSLHELAGGEVEVAKMRSVELQDLLRREPIVLDEAGIGAVISGKRVLVTGAGGSIGSEICAQLMKHTPSELFLLGHGEGSIYNLVQSVGRMEGTARVPHRPIIADIAVEDAMERVFSDSRPDVVFHAAAHKHVPLMEENPREALRVNSLGTWTLAQLAGRFGAERFVMISSDKAVHPSSIMGATKRIAERLLCGAQVAYSETAFITVRFGNVLGSRGSVVPLFERQIEMGGPVTVTHPEMNRYFMLIPEAVSLVLQAASMGRGGELYVLDMGEPVNILEMAETLIRLHGREPYKDIHIRFTGIRPGEKLHEELFYESGHVNKTLHSKIFLSTLTDRRITLIDDVRKLLELGADTQLLREGIFSLCEI
ncbi:MAG: polysaccharide biosynthesis protein [Synergistaceae bacterium]|jgi:FlaA1/EpsC-like NDP-sugar epimerase|nr:polysaccharide biosynthesis protein [Synergistaceae bacterium]